MLTRTLARMILPYARIADARKGKIILRSGWPPLVAALIACLLAPVRNAVASSEPSAQQIDAIFAAIASPRDPGLAVLVRKGGRTVFERGYGLRDMRSSLPIDERTDFRLASFTKQFTAL